jgi:hypothetical protein
MKLLMELNEDVEYILEENTEGEKDLYVKGIFLQGNIKNRNGRIYPIDTLLKEVNRYNEQKISKGTALGELDHPQEPTVKLQRASHLITELKQDGNNFIGKAKILDTDMGRNARGLIKGGAKLGISSRGLGSLKEENGSKIVQNDLRLETAGDLVSDPSAPEAWMDSIMEATEWVMQNGEWVQQYREETKKQLDEMVRTRESREDREARYMKLFKGFLKKIGE